MHKHKFAALVTKRAFLSLDDLVANRQKTRLFMEFSAYGVAGL